MAYKALDLQNSAVSDAIIDACDVILRGDADSFFVTHPLQGEQNNQYGMTKAELIKNSL